MVSLTREESDMLIYLTLNAYQNQIFLSCCCCFCYYCKQWSTHPLRLRPCHSTYSQGSTRPPEHPLMSAWTGNGPQAEWALALSLRLLLTSMDVSEEDGGPTTGPSTDVGGFIPDRSMVVDTCTADGAFSEEEPPCCVTWNMFPGAFGFFPKINWNEVINHELAQ